MLEKAFSKKENKTGNVSLDKFLRGIETQQKEMV
jgi:hypothetical protein